MRKTRATNENQSYFPEMEDKSEFFKCNGKTKRKIVG